MLLEDANYCCTPLGKAAAAAAFRQQTAGVSRHVLPKATRLVSRSLPLQYTRHPRFSVTTNRNNPLGFLATHHHISTRSLSHGELANIVCGVSGGVETKAAECMTGECRARGAGCGAARRGPPLLCTRRAPVHLGFRPALPRGSASVPPRQARVPATWPDPGDELRHLAPHAYLYPIDKTP
ncbi:unnamed protein product, partial [Iphiclides podalirius]